MPSAALKASDFYQWSATSPPVDGPAPAEPQAAPADAGAQGRLTDRLNAKLAELRVAGFNVLRIEAPVEALTTLLIEGGDEAIMLDPDPASDLAWFGGSKIRHSSHPGVRVFLEGEVEGEVSCHIV